MTNKIEIIKPQVRALRAYTLSPHHATVKINQNENPWETPVKIKEEIDRRLTNHRWSRYPDFTPARLHKCLASHAGWTAEGVLAGNGSNELIQAVLMVTVGKGKRVLLSEPTFTLYRQIATVMEGEVSSVPLTSNLTYAGGELRRVVVEINSDITIICSPNNPTGCVLPDEDLRELLKTSNGLVVIDEAYHEFADHSVVSLLNEYRNLIVLRTFSKAMAMAGLRIGYLLAAPEIAREVSKALLPYNLNVISQTAAEVAIELYEEELRPMVQKIIAERGRLFSELAKISGLTPIKSEANFMVVKSRVNPRAVFEQLLGRDILIRDVSSYPMLSDYFRVSVGKPEENDKLICALKEIFE